MPGAPVAAIAERRLIDRLLRARAFSVATAVPLTDLRFAEERGLERLRQKSVVREDTPGAYYLDGPALADHWSSRRLRIAVLAFAIAVILAGMVFAMKAQ